MREIHRVKSKITLQLEPGQIVGAAVGALVLVAGAFCVGRVLGAGAAGEMSETAVVEAEGKAAKAEDVDAEAASCEAAIRQALAQQQCECPVCAPVTEAQALSAAGASLEKPQLGALFLLTPQLFDSEPLSPEAWRERLAARSGERHRLYPKEAPPLNFPKSNGIGVMPEPSKFSSDSPSAPFDTPKWAGFKTSDVEAPSFVPAPETVPSVSSDVPSQASKRDSVLQAGSIENPSASSVVMPQLEGRSQSERAVLGGHRSSGDPLRVPDMHDGTTARPPVEGRYAHVGDRQLPRRLEAGSLGGRYSVQIEAFRERRDADELQGRLRSQGFEAHVVQVELDGQLSYRVRLGHFETLEEARDFQERYRARTGASESGFIVEEDAARR